jgi:hypothetical protein
MRRQASDSFTKSVRYAMPALVFCEVTAVEVAHAKFTLMWAVRGLRLEVICSNPDAAFVI